LASKRHVGREADSTSSQVAFERHPRLKAGVVNSGQPGVGKSRLLGDMLEYSLRPEELARARAFQGERQAFDSFVARGSICSRLQKMPPGWAESNGRRFAGLRRRL
jgi:hypothetical protein